MSEFFWLLVGFGVLAFLAQVGHGLEIYLMHKDERGDKKQ